MSTRAIYSFKSADSADPVIHVYRHYDGYPSGAVDWISAALKLAWPLPRYENDEFAAAFVAANKDGPGSVRLISGKEPHEFAADIEYLYEIEPRDEAAASENFLQPRGERKPGEFLLVTVYATDFWGPQKIKKELWQGPLAAMKAWAKNFDKAA
jgi:hypothetical protein